MAGECHCIQQPTAWSFSSQLLATFPSSAPPCRSQFPRDVDVCLHGLAQPWSSGARLDPTGRGGRRGARGILILLLSLLLAAARAPAWQGASVATAVSGDQKLSQKDLDEHKVKRLSLSSLRKSPSQNQGCRDPPTAPASPEKCEITLPWL